MLTFLFIYTALPLPRGWGLDSVLGEPARLQLQLADLGRFEDQHNDRLGWHSRNIMAVAPEVSLVVLQQPLLWLLPACGQCLLAQMIWATKA